MVSKEERREKKRKERAEQRARELNAIRMHTLSEVPEAQWPHIEVHPRRGRAAGTAKRTRSNPLEEYLERKIINRHLYDAGIRWGDDYAIWKAGGVSSLEGMGGTSSRGYTDRQHDALERYQLAARAITDSKARATTHLVACWSMYLELSTLSANQREAEKTRLRIGLEALAVHYGLIVKG